MDSNAVNVFRKAIFESALLGTGIVKGPLNFYKRVQPGGWWGPINKNYEHELQPVSKGFFILWISGIMMIYGFTFGLGNLIFHNYSNAILLFGLSGIGSFLVWNRSISKLN